MKKTFLLLSALLASFLALADDAMQTTPLTIEALDDGVVHFNNMASGPVYYSVNGGAKQTIAAYTFQRIQVKEDDKVAFFGDNGKYANENLYVKEHHIGANQPTGDSDNPTSILGCSVSYYVYGNIMSLVSSENFANVKELKEDNAFLAFFDGESRMKNHETKQLLLPATTLTASCYALMFNRCTGLTVAPALPATSLADYCYEAMFRVCYSLTSAPVLPATELSYGCYMNMFCECIRLQTPPALPAVALAESCYESMFNKCYALQEAPELPALTLQKACYGQMFYSCSSLVSAPALPATTLTEQCYTYMFKNCSKLQTAPVLPAPTLTDYCYYQMFAGCSALNHVTCLATDISAKYCTQEWLTGVSSTGTFTRADGMKQWSAGTSGIPVGWTSDDYGTGISELGNRAAEPSCNAIYDLSGRQLSPAGGGSETPAKWLRGIYIKGGRLFLK